MPVALAPVSKSFESEIQRILKLYPNGKEAKTIKLIEEKFGKARAYFTLFENAGLTLGLASYEVVAIYGKGKKPIGYRSYWNFQDTNAWNKNGGIQYLTTNVVSESSAYRFLAKETLYLFLRCPNLKEALEQ